MPSVLQPTPQNTLYKSVKTFLHVYRQSEEISPRWFTRHKVRVCQIGKVGTKRQITHLNRSVIWVIQALKQNNIAAFAGRPVHLVRTKDPYRKIYQSDIEQLRFQKQNST